MRNPNQRALLIWWLTGSATLLVILLVAAGYFAISTFESFAHSHPNGCLPSDFPTYPNVTVQEIDESFAVPGSIAQCRMRMSSREVFEPVRSFYRAELEAGDWKTTGYAAGAATADINFERRSHPSTRGVVSIFGQPGGTEIQVQLSG